MMFEFVALAPRVVVARKVGIAFSYLQARAFAALPAKPALICFSV
jgi:hypothetical protein